MSARPWPSLFFILSGLFRFFVGANFGGLWLAFIGWFLLDAARSSYVVEGHLSLQDFVDEYVLRTGRRCFVVIQNEKVSGLITTHEVKKVHRDSWSQTSVQSVMRPLSQLRTVAPDTPCHPRP